MQALGIYTGRDLKQLDRIQLQTHFGRSGDFYYNIARGIDERPVSASRKRKSIGSETTFAENLIDKREIWQTLMRLSESVVTSLEKRQFSARTLTLKVRYGDFTNVTRSLTPPEPSFSLEHFKQHLPELLKRTQVGERPIRLIGITAHNIQPRKQKVPSEPDRDTKQLGLF